MIKRLVITMALAGLSGSAIAADLRGPIIEAPPPLPLPAAGFVWTGAYAGVNVGLGAGTSNYSYDVNGYGSTTTPGYYDPCGCTYYPATTTSYPYNASGAERLRQSGVLGGVQVGYNYALGGVGGLGVRGGFLPVIGVEADFDGSGIGSSGALSDFANGFPVGINNYVGVHSDINYFGTVRGRLGVAFDRLLVYGTGGFAYADVQSSVSSPANGVYASSHNFHTGIAYGGGVEFAITNNLLLRAEYLHLDLNRKAIIANGGDPWLGYSVYEKPSIDLVRAGLSYKFDAAYVAPPVIARY